MSEIFADSFYWIALANPADASHQTATNFSQTNIEAVLVTTDEVLSEFLNYFSAAGESKRSVVANMFEETMNHPRVLVIPQTRESLLRGFTLYKARAEHGLERTILQSTPQGLPIYQRMGYRTVTRVTVYSS